MQKRYKLLKTMQTLNKNKFNIKNQVMGLQNEKKKIQKFKRISKVPVEPTIKQIVKDETKEIDLIDAEMDAYDTIVAYIDGFNDPLFGQQSLKRRLVDLGGLLSNSQHTRKHY